MNSGRNKHSDRSSQRVRKAEVGVMYFEDGGWGYGPRSVGRL